MMFRDIVDPSVRVGGKKTLALPLSIAAHVAFLGLALLVPLMAPGVLPVPTATLMAWVTRDIVLPPEPPPAPRRLAAVEAPVMDTRSNTAPLEAPPAITPERIIDAVPTPLGVVEGSGNLAASLVEELLPPPPPLPTAPDVPVRIGGNIKPPTKIKDVRPSYPAIAQAARIQGVVIIETTIGATGRVLDARVLRSIPLLDAAALDAVRQWEFTPTLLNGTPVAVVMTVTVNFRLE